MTDRNVHHSVEREHQNIHVFKTHCSSPPRAQICIRYCSNKQQQRSGSGDPLNEITDFLDLSHGLVMVLKTLKMF
jgi:hypothetical protein